MIEPSPAASLITQNVDKNNRSIHRMKPEILKEPMSLKSKPGHIAANSQHSQGLAEMTRSHTGQFASSTSAGPGISRTANLQAAASVQNSSSNPRLRNFVSGHAHVLQHANSLNGTNGHISMQQRFMNNPEELQTHGNGMSEGGASQIKLAQKLSSSNG